jgi:CO/xanthine dehydrogenase Mo-binding subunit
MLFAKLLLSPMPHARVTRIDASAALAMPGVKAILTADDLPAPADSVTDAGAVIRADLLNEPALTNEPLYRGEPILAVAAVDEQTAAEAIERIQIDFEPLPFVVDPLEAMRPGSPNPREAGNVWMPPAPPTPPAGAGRGAAPAAGAAAGAQGAAPAQPAAAAPPAQGPGAATPPSGTAARAGAGAPPSAGAALAAGAAAAPGAPGGRGRGGATQGGPPRPEIKELKWTEEDFAEYAGGRMPMGKAATEWSYGDVEAGFKSAALVLDESFVTPSTPNAPLESRTAMAYWQNGKLYLHCSTQSTIQTVPAVARWVGIEPSQVVLIAEYCGGAFGSKVSGSITMAIPALLSRKANAPVMMRISREEEHHIGRWRPALHGRVKAGFDKQGRIVALDFYSVIDNGPYEQQSDLIMTGRMVSLMYQPQAMRWRGVSVVTNTMPTGPQSAPGGAQAVMVMEPVLTKAARALGIDQVAIHRINAPEGKAQFAQATPRGQRSYVTSAFVKEALDRGAELFKWEERKAASGQRRGSKIRGVGVAVSPYISGSTGFDGLFVIKPDGRMAIQSGIGNLGTESAFDSHRVAAEMLDVPWEKVDITWGNTANHLPWSCISGGSQTIHAMTRAAYAAASDATRKLQEIAARDLGGRPEDYEIGGERVFRRGGGRGLTLAQAARRAVELGGAYDGHELPKDINAFTRASATALAGQGLMGVARDSAPRDGQTHSYVAGFAEVEVDVETGVYQIVDYLAVGDVGTVIHPRSLGGQLLGRSMLGIGHTIGQKNVYDQHYGVPLATRFYQNRPPTILDAPAHMAWDAVNLPDPETPIGARGVGEPPVGAGACAVMNALANALGDDIFRRAPVMLDMILTSLEAGKPVHEPLTAHI